MPQRVPTRDGERLQLQVFLDVFRCRLLWRNTFVYVGIAIPLEFGLGLIIALSLATITAGRGVLHKLLIIPQMLAPVAMALMWKFMYNDELGQ